MAPRIIYLLILILLSGNVQAVATETATLEFTSTAQAFFYILMFFLWVVFLMTAFFRRGTTGNVIGVFNIMQAILGVITGIAFMSFSQIIGLATAFMSVGIFAGLSME